jgi:branched-chain amino acid transport system permease protein
MTTTVRRRPPSFARRHAWWIALVVAALVPLVDLLLPGRLRITGMLVPVLAYALVALGLNIVVGFTGLLHLGSAAFMAVGAYAFAILTAPSCPFQLGFWPGLGLATLAGAVAGMALALPTMRLRGDYLTVVTLGCGEIVRELLKNLSPITKGSQGINPLPAPEVGPWTLTAMQPMPWYWLFLAIVALATALCLNLRRSAVGRAWTAVREDELAARASGVRVDRAKRSAFTWGAALCALGGALAAAYSTGVEPSVYDFQMSVTVLCIVVIGGMGSVAGVLLGTAVMMGFNQVGVPLLTRLLGGGAESHPLLDANNWKFMIFGLALIIAMRLRPEGLLPAREVRDELHHADEDDPESAREGVLR